MRSRFLLLALVAGALLFSRAAAPAATLTVNSDADAGGTCPGPTCTLRQAILAAASGDTINFAEGIAIINLTSAELYIDKNLTINGHTDGNPLTVQRSTTNGDGFEIRIVNIASSANVTISGLTIADGIFASGGGIANSGTLTLIGCTISGNGANDGGGIYNFSGATLNIASSLISLNTGCSCGNGAGINNSSGAIATITNSTISGNDVNENGGGIYNAGTITITNSTVASNNTFGFGGGIYNTSAATLSARNTIIAANTGATFGVPDFSGVLDSQGYNLIGNTTGTIITGSTTGNQLNVDPDLGLLQDNGGLTFTQSLLPQSRAIDGGDSSGSNTDQRGFIRPVDFPTIPNATDGDGSDIGAFEVQSNPTPVPGQFAIAVAGPASIEEFVIQGTKSKEVTIKGTGPVLSLYDIAGDLLGTNDNNSAIVAILSSGTYVAALTDTLGNPIAGSLEIDDSKPTNSLIAAIGSRGNAPLVSTLTITGTEPQSFLLRALGPSLASFGITGGLADPVLALSDSNGNLLVFNDNWENSPDKQAIKATGLAPFDDLESAILVPLTPGAYTLTATGVNDGGGIAFVDAYSIPYTGTALNPAPNLTPPPPTPTPSPTVPAKSLNISTRARVEVGDGVSIGGFIVTGAVSKKILIRAIGPSLKNAGLTDFLDDPVLDLDGANGGLILENDNWKDNADQAAQIQATGIPPQDDLESAMVVTLSPGAYTAIISGKDGATGLALVEVYDLDQASDSQLANISTRCSIQTGDNVAIGGFILGGGNGSSSVIVRAIGPSLSEQGLLGELADPTLDLRDANGMSIAFDDNWQDDSGQAAQITAAGLAPRDELEAAIATALFSGSYTAIVAGKNGTTGIGLIEIYNLQEP